MSVIAREQGAVGVVADPPGRDAPSMVAPPGDGRSGGGAGSRVFESLRVPAFRWYLGAQFGTWGVSGMQMFVNGFLVWDLTDSYAALSLMLLVRGLPALPMTLVGGVMADRRSRKRLVQTSQFVLGGLSLGVALLLVLGLLRLEYLLIGVLLQGATMSLVTPARIAMLPGLVGIARIQNAQALELGAITVMLLLGPMIAGMTMLAVGEEYAYLLMAALSFSAALMYAKVPHVERQVARADDGSPMVGRRSPFRDLLGGARYVVRDRTIRVLFGVSVAFALVPISAQYLSRGYAREVMDIGDGRAAALLGVAALGALLVVGVIAAMPPRHRGRILIVGSLVTAGAVAGFSVTTSLLVAAPLIAVVSVGQTTRVLLSGVLVQTHVDDAYRGRVSSLLLIVTGTGSLALLPVGRSVPSVGLQGTIGVMALISMVLAVLIWFLVPRLRDLD